MCYGKEQSLPVSIYRAKQALGFQRRGIKFYYLSQSLLLLKKLDQHFTFRKFVVVSIWNYVYIPLR